MRGWMVMRVSALVGTVVLVCCSVVDMVLRRIWYASTVMGGEGVVVVVGGESEVLGVWGVCEEEGVGGEMGQSSFVERSPSVGVVSVERSATCMEVMPSCMCEMFWAMKSRPRMSWQDGRGVGET